MRVLPCQAAWTKRTPGGLIRRAFCHVVATSATFPRYARLRRSARPAKPISMNRPEVGSGTPLTAIQPTDEIRPDCPAHPIEA